MIGRCLCKSMVVTVVLYVWMTLSWTVLPWHDAVTDTFKDGQEVAEVMKDNAPDAGVYMYPGMDAKDMKSEMNVYAFVAPDGLWGGSAHQMIGAFVIQFIIAFIAVWMMCCAANSVKCTVGYMMGIGLLLGVSMNVPLWNWMGAPWDFILVGVLDNLIGWTLAGIALRWTCCKDDGSCKA